MQGLARGGRGARMLALCGVGGASTKRDGSPGAQRRLPPREAPGHVTQGGPSRGFINLANSRASESAEEKSGSLQTELRGGDAGPPWGPVTGRRRARHPSRARAPRLNHSLAARLA